MSSSLDNLVAVLEACCSPDNEARQRAEALLRQAGSTPGFGNALVHISLDGKRPMHARQLAAVYLKQFLRECWKPRDGTTPSRFQKEGKRLARTMLLEGLKDTSRLMRTAFGMCVATIAQSDWPEEWPDLFDHLVSAVNSGNEVHVLGAVRCMSLFCDFLDDLMVPKLAPSLFPALTRVFADDSTFGPETRKYACTVIKTCVVLLGALRHNPESPAFSAISDALKNWLQPLMSALSLQAWQRQQAWYQQRQQIQVGQALGASGGVAEDLDLCHGYGVQIEALQVVTVVVQDLYKLIGADSIRNIFMAIWKYTEQLIPIYVSQIVNANDGGTESGAAESTQIYDREGNSLGMEVLMVQVFEFLNMTAVVPSQSISQLVAQGLPQIFRSCAVVMQMSDGHVAEWKRADDVEGDSGAAGMHGMQEDGDVLDAFSTTGELRTRNVAACLVDELADTFEGAALNAAAGAVTWGMQQTQQLLSSGQSQNQSWWKPLEAALMIAGLLSSSVKHASNKEGALSPLKASDVAATAMHYVQSGGAAVSQVGPFAPSPVLLSRCVWTLGRYSWALKGRNEILTACQSVVAILSANHPLPVRISACRSLPSLSSHMKSLNHQELGEQERNSFLMTAVQGICQLLSAPALSCDVLPAIIGVLAEILEGNSQTACLAEPHLTPALVQVWSQNASNPHLCGAIVEVFQSIASSPTALPGLQVHLLPTLCSLVSNHSTNLPGIVEYALDLMAVISRHAPLSTEYLSMALPPVLQYMQVSDDNAGLASGAVCLSAFVYAGSNALMTMQAIQMNGGTEKIMPAILGILSRLLSPEIIPDLGAVGAGGLFVQIVMKFSGVMQPAAIQNVFYAMLVRLAAAKYSSLKQSIVMAFARLMLRDIGSVVRALLSLPVIRVPAKSSNIPAFNLLVEQWVAEQPSFTGRFQVKVSLMALAQLYKTHADTCAQVVVQGDLVVDVNEKRRTRSQGRRKLQYASIPLSLRIMQLLLRSVDDPVDENHLSDFGIMEGGNEAASGNAKGSLMGASGIFAAADDFEEFMLSDIGAGFWDQEEEDDEDDMLGAGVDAKDDPVFALDLQEELKKWFKSLTAQELSSLSSALTNMEDREKLDYVTGTSR